MPLPGLGTTDGFAGRLVRHGDVLLLHGLRHAHVDLSLRAGHQHGHALAQGRACPPTRSDYVTEQVFYNSKDGTRVLMFITHKRDMKKDGNQPTLLYGYGGFNARRHANVPRAVPRLAGDGRRARGSEHPRRRRIRRGLAPRRYAQSQAERVRRLHRGGRIPDPREIHQPKRLAIHGRSNGGLLVGAVLLQRPDLFGAALPTVGVLDMLRYHTASANARQWSTDYGPEREPGRLQSAVRLLPRFTTPKTAPAIPRPSSPLQTTTTA